MRLSLSVCLASLASLQAGTFTNSFNSGLPPGTAMYGVAFVDAVGGPDGSGCLKLTSATNSTSGGFILDDLDAWATVNSFTAQFQLVLGGGTATPADGFSFNFAGDLPDGTISEEGAGTGLTVEFDTYPNTGERIGIDVKWAGTEIATYPMATADLVTWPNYVPVLIQLTNGALNVTYNGTSIYTNLAIPGFLPIQGRFGLGARCGGMNENAWLDNLGITTSPVLLPYVVSNSPTGTGIRPDPVITVGLYNSGASQVDYGSIQMKLNGATVTPNIIFAYPVTLVQYTPPALPSGSTNTVVLTFADNSASPKTQTNQFSFVVITYPTIPASYAATADTGSPGFAERIFQGGTATVNSIAAAETLLGGLLLNPATGLPFPNTALTNSDGSWSFVESNVLNYNIYAPTNTGHAGNFDYDLPYPGLPGTNGSLVNFALEANTYLYLTPGIYNFGVNSDDGFRLTCLDKLVGLFDGSRGAADTTFYFAVAQSGYYPFRLVHFQGTGGGSLEWFSVSPEGQKSLINDYYAYPYILAYSQATFSRPHFLGSWPAGTGNRPDKPILVQLQDGIGTQVNTNTIRLSVNGTIVTPTITQSGDLTTVQYNALWSSASSNFVVVSFADNQAPPLSQTNQFSFSVLAYTNLPTSYAIDPAAVDTSKPGFLQKVFQTDRVVPYTIANAEIMLAGQLTDGAGAPCPNQAATNTDGSCTFAQPNTLNYNLATPATAGNFNNDTQFPGLPGANNNTNTFALEAITYLYLPVGYYNLGVNSDDGFRLTTAPNPSEEFPYQLSVFDGTRGPSDTTTAFGVTQAGYYPFRLVYFQATGPASLELFSVAPSGQKLLVNDTNNPGSIRAYRSANNTQPYVQWAYPYRNGTYSLYAGIPPYFLLVDGTPAIQLDSIQLTVNDLAVTPTIIRTNGTNILVTFDPAAFQQTTNTTATVQLTYADASGRIATDAFSFLFYGSNALTPLWNLAPGSRPYLTSDPSAGAQECGMGLNPLTGHLLLGSISNSTTLRGVYVLDGLTGADLGELARTNAAGVNLFAPAAFTYFPSYSIGVAADGVIYAANRKQLSFQVFNLYRWAGETSPASVAFSDSLSKFQFPLGYDLCVRGTGTNTQIILGAGNSSTLSSQAVLFTTTDGSTFTPTTISVSGVANDLFGGIAFGADNTFYAEGAPGTVLRLVSFTPGLTTASALASYNWIATAGSLGPLGVDLGNGHVIGLATSSTAGNPHTVNLYDLNTLSTTDLNYPIDSCQVPTAYANANGSGSVVFTPDGSMVFVLDTENGILAYALGVQAAARPTLSVALSGANIVLTWPDADFLLQSAPEVTGTYTNIETATSPYTNPISPAPGAKQFFRLRHP